MVILLIILFEMISLKLDHKKKLVSHKNHIFRYIYMSIFLINLIHINIRDVINIISTLCVI